MSKEVDRQFEIIYALENLADVAKRLKSPTSEEIALFQISANMAVAGTDKSAQELLPAMESGVETSSKTFGKKIAAALEKAWAILKHLVLSITSIISNLINDHKKVALRFAQLEKDDSVRLDIKTTKGNLIADDLVKRLCVKNESNYYFSIDIVNEAFTAIGKLDRIIKNILHLILMKTTML
jgi:hypothetical protein